ncbi:PREDICTED: olfactory receptor 14A16-like [Chrysochloris asiatica]|uniref:Olfactory receptor n=1 Tax=Chrysochloris asiatica TaxID=185453 RepID=A0A9B0X2N6_CHRAS|nr:PREDICTED: olfactory receptor 14A16-like [Chrysochloris asiatica]
MTNLTVVTEFFLIGFSTNKTMYVLHSVLFIMIYLVALMGNVLIILITSLDKYLHTPMYFFLKNLSFLDLCLISVTIPKSIINSLTQNNSISFFGCVTQVLLVVFSTAAELFLLTVMSFDRYAAICHPLHYDVIMKRDVCLQMATMSWLGGVVFAVMHTAGTFSLSFCSSNMIHQFFCDIPQLLAISCSESLLSEIIPILISVVIDICCFIFIIISYVYIFSTVKKIPSTEGQSKAYITCFPHLVVVVLFLSTGFIAYLKPTSNSPSISDLIITVFYTIVPPTLNPIIYSLRNKAMKIALRMLVEGKLIQK